MTDDKLDIIIAKDIMGFIPIQAKGMPKSGWTQGTSHKIFRFNPSSDPFDNKLLKERIIELGFRIETHIDPGGAFVKLLKDKDRWNSYSISESRALCQVAAKTVGVEFGGNK